MAGMHKVEGENKVRRMSILSDLETIMRRLSQLISGLALGLMLAGFISMLFIQIPLLLPGVSSIRLAEILDNSHLPFGLYAMSIGIVLLASLPALRVFVALILFLPGGDWLNILAALLVFLELLLSTIVAS
jgi:uncharacterized membrane protein